MNIKLPSIDEAETIAIEIAMINNDMSAQEEAFFIAGFQECIKYLNLKNELKLSSNSMRIYNIIQNYLSFNILYDTKIKDIEFDENDFSEIVELIENDLFVTIYDSKIRFNDLTTIEDMINKVIMNMMKK